MNDPLPERLRDSQWRRKLTASEEAGLRAWLAGHPEQEPDWAAEAGLAELLSRLPDAPVPTNFTARVLQAVEQDSQSAARARTGWNRFWRPFLPRAAVAAAVVLVGLLSYERHEAAQRAVLARNLATVTDFAGVPNADAMENFDAVRQLGRTPPPDDELLALLR